MLVQVTLTTTLIITSNFLVLSSYIEYPNNSDVLQAPEWRSARLRRKASSYLKLVIHSRRAFIIRCCGRRSCSGPHWRSSTTAKATTAPKKPQKTTTKLKNKQTTPVRKKEAKKDTETTTMATSVEDLIDTEFPSMANLSTDQLELRTERPRMENPDMGDVTVTKSSQPCESPACPTVECTTESAFFNAEGGLKVSPDAAWIPASCGAVFWTSSNFQSTYDEATELCCQMGMKIITVDSLSKVQCLQEASLFAKQSIFIQYWTSASGCYQNYQWCPSGDIVQLDQETIVWMPGYPTNVSTSNNCIAMHVTDETYGSKLYFKNMLCNKMNAIICEGPVDVPQPEQLPPEPGSWDP